MSRFKQSMRSVVRGQNGLAVLLAISLLLPVSTGFATTSDPITEVTSNTELWQVYPAIETADDVSHAAWFERGSGWNGPTNIRYARSDNNGTTWSSSIQLNDVTGKAYATYRQHQPSIVADDDEVWIFWISKATNPNKIVFKHSIDGGVTWADELVAHAWSDGRDGQFAKAAMDGLGTLFLVWQQFEGSHPDNLEGPRNLHSSSTTDGGSTWTTPVIIDAYNTGNRNSDPENGYPCDCCSQSLLGRAEGGLEVVYRHVEYDTAAEEWLNVVGHISFDGLNGASGYTALAPAWRTEGVICPSTDADLALHDDGLLVAWSDARSGSNEVWFAILNGTTVSSVTRLGSGDLPEIVVEGEWLRATWYNTARNLCFAEGNTTAPLSNWVRETALEEEAPQLSNRTLLWSEWRSGSWEISATPAPMPDWLWQEVTYAGPPDNGSENETGNQTGGGNGTNGTIDPPDANGTGDGTGNGTGNGTGSNGTGNGSTAEAGEVGNVGDDPGGSDGDDAIEWPEAVVGELAPDFTMRDVDGVEFSLSDYSGDHVIIDLAATWCQNCATFSQNVLSPLQAEIDSGDRAALTILTIGTDIGESDELFASWAAAHNSTWRHSVDDTDAGVREMYGSTVPRIGVVGPDGTLLMLHEGYVDVEDLLELLERTRTTAGTMEPAPTPTHGDTSGNNFPLPALGFISSTLALLTGLIAAGRRRNLAQR